MPFRPRIVGKPDILGFFLGKPVWKEVMHIWKIKAGCKDV